MRTVNANQSCLCLPHIWAVTEPLREHDPNLDGLFIRLHPAQSVAYKELIVLCCSPTQADREWLRQQDREVQKAIGKMLAGMLECFTHRARFKIDSTMPKDEIEFWETGFSWIRDPQGHAMPDAFSGNLVAKIFGLAVPFGFLDLPRGQVGLLEGPQ